MFRIGDKVEFPVTQSIAINNELSSGAKMLIRYARQTHHDSLVVRNITARNGMHEFHVGISIDDYAYSTVFYGCDLVPYGHSGLMFAPAVVGTSRVKCHCGKTHQLMTNNGTSSTIHTAINDSAGWHIRLNNSFVKKPRGQQWYVYYVAYCPECWEIEKQRRQSAEQLLPPMPGMPSIETVLTATQPAWEEPPTETITPNYDFSVRGTIISEPSRPQQTKPFSIWVHHKGGARI